MNTSQMLERRAQLVKEMRDMQDAADNTSGGNMTEDQQRAFDALKAALADLESAMQRRALIEESERRMMATTALTGADRAFDRGLHEFSIVRAIGAAAGLDVDAGREREISQEIARRSGRQFSGIAVPVQALVRRMEQRAPITTTAPSGGLGGNLIATMLDGNQYIDLLRAALCIRQLGARVLSGLVGNVDAPRMNAAGSVGWVAENTALPTTSEGFDKVSLRPKHAGAIVELSRNMLQQTTPDVEQLVREDLAAVLARALDSAAIAGTGSSNDPTGILNTSGVTKLPLGTTGGPLSYYNVQDLMGLVMTANAAQGSLAFLSNTKVRQHAAKMITAQGLPLGLDKIFQDTPQTWSNLVPSNLTKGGGTGLSALIYGNWADLLIGFWSELDILVNPFESTAYSKGNVQVRAMMTCDIQLRHPESFAAIVDIDTTMLPIVLAPA